MAILVPMVILALLATIMCNLALGTSVEAPFYSLGYSIAVKTNLGPILFFLFVFKDGVSPF